MQVYHPSRFCTAPMIDWTDRHCRAFFRLFSKEMQIYTEMVTTGAILNGDQERFLGFNDVEQPLVLQLGGSNPAALATCVTLAAQRGYSEVNLNLGCPSPRVQKGAFGACLMAESQLVADCVKAMQDASDLPISVKCRLGIDQLDSDAFLLDFLGALDQVQCQHWVIHARIALLEGLSPKENRTIPPLNYPRVALVKHTFPHARVILNGGLVETQAAKEAMGGLDGVMFGRSAYQNPQVLLEVDQVFFERDTTGSTPFEIAQNFTSYLQPLPAHEQKRALRHTLGLFNGFKGAKIWRRLLAEGLTDTSDPLGLWQSSLDALSKMQKLKI